jgi:microcystin-dependent protein
VTDPFLSEIALFSFSNPPRGWAACDGQLLPINQNQALFSLLGTTYGGNGQTTFALPDLRGRVAMGVGGTHFLGERDGSATVTLAVAGLPAHTHAVNVSGLSATARCRDAAANQQSPVAGTPAVEATGSLSVYSSAPPDANMRSGGVAVGGSLVAAETGGGQPHENRQPYLALNYCIALQGIFPPRP